MRNIRYFYLLVSVVMILCSCQTGDLDLTPSLSISQDQIEQTSNDPTSIDESDAASMIISDGEAPSSAEVGDTLAPDLELYWNLQSGVYRIDIDADGVDEVFMWGFSAERKEPVLRIYRNDTLLLEEPLSAPAAYVFTCSFVMDESRNIYLHVYKFFNHANRSGPVYLEDYSLINDELVLVGEDRLWSTDQGDTIVPIEEVAPDVQKDWLPTIPTAPIGGSTFVHVII